MGYYMGPRFFGAGWGGHWLWGVLAWVLIIVGAYYVVRWLTGDLAPGNRPLRTTGPNSPALDVLRERYVKGEISREEFLEKKQDLEGP